MIMFHRFGYPATDSDRGQECGWFQQYSLNQCYPTNCEPWHILKQSFKAHYQANMLQKVYTLALPTQHETQACLVVHKAHVLVQIEERHTE